MAKKSLKINQFHGGLNNYRDRRDTPDNALVNVSNVMCDVPGKIRMMGRDFNYTNLVSGSPEIEGAATAGYGLSVFRADHAPDGTDTQNSEFIIYQNGNSFNLIYNSILYTPTDDTNVGGFVATTWTGTSKPIFHYLNERLFVSDANFLNTSNHPYVYEYLSHARFPSTSGDYDAAEALLMNVPAGWYSNLVNYPKLTNLKSIKHAATQNPAANTDQHMRISAQNIAGTGDWGDQTLWMGVSVLYGDEESSIQHSDGADYRVAIDDASTGTALSLGFSIALDTGTVTLDKRITGFKLYLMAANSGTSPIYHKDPSLLAEVDLVNELMTSHEGKTSVFAFSAALAGDIDCFRSLTSLTITSLPTTTFEMENLYAHDVETVRAKWKTATTMGKQIFAGNVKRYNDAGTLIATEADKILRVMPPPLSKRAGIFPASDFLEIGIGDGDEIIALESFADRLLVFKRLVMYIVNISGDIEFIEQEHKFIGVNNPYSIARTEIGVMWVNKHGAFLYDGEKVSNLMDGKIDTYISPTSISFDDNSNATRDSTPGWIDFIGDDGGQVGYISTSKQLVVLDSPSDTGEGDRGNMMIYDLKTQSWTYGVGRISGSARSNIINNINNSFLFLGSLSAGGNDISMSIINNGVASVDFHYEIKNMSDECITNEGLSYKLIARNNEGTVDITNSFTYTSNDSVHFSFKVSEEIRSKGYDAGLVISDDYDEINRLGSVTLKRAAAQASVPDLFGRTIEWLVEDGVFEVPSIGSLALKTAGVGQAVAPVRAWFHSSSMEDLINAGGRDSSVKLYRNMRKTWGGMPDGNVLTNVVTTLDMETISDDGINMTTGGMFGFELSTVKTMDDLETFISAMPAGMSPIFTTFPALPLASHIYQWIINKASAWLNISREDTSYLMSGDTGGGSNLGMTEDGESTGTTLDDNDTSFSQSWLPGDKPWDWVIPQYIQGYYDIYGPGGAEKRQILIDEFSKRNQSDDLHCYIGFVIKPGAGGTFLSNNFNYNISYKFNLPSNDIEKSSPSICVNPRLIRYMCDFNNNIDLEAIVESGLAVSGDEEDNKFVLPGEGNQGNYVSPGLVFTQAWQSTTGDQDYLDEDFAHLDEYNAGNGKYKNDSGSQADTKWPNGYFYFGVGANNANTSIVEGTGQRYIQKAAIDYTSDKYTDPTHHDLKDLETNNTQFLPFDDKEKYSPTFCGTYFIGRKVRWSDAIDSSPSGDIYRAISDDLLKPNKHAIFRNFGDMVDGNINCSSNDKVGLITDGDGVAIQYSRNNENKGYSTKLGSYDILFNAQSKENANTAHPCDNIITRDEAYISEPDFSAGSADNGARIQSLRKIGKFPDTTSDAFAEHGYHIPGQRNLGITADYTEDVNGIDQDAVIYQPDWKDNTITSNTAGIASYSYAEKEPVCYTSIPYLVIEVNKSQGAVSSITLHYIGEWSKNNAFDEGAKFSFSLPSYGDYDYSIDDIILSSGSIVNVDTNIKRNFSNHVDSALNDSSYEGSTYDVIHERTWGLDSYISLTFDYSEQTDSVKSQMLEKYDLGTVAFWSNPLNETSSESNLYGGTNSSEYYAIAKDYQLGEIQDAPNTSFTTGSSSSFFNITSKGVNGEKREIILHNNRSVGGGADTVEEVQLNLYISDKDGPTTGIKTKTYNASNIGWKSGAYDTSFDIQNELLTAIDSDTNRFWASDSFVQILGMDLISSGGSNGVTCGPNQPGTGKITLIFNPQYSVESTSPEYGQTFRSLTPYIRAGDTIWFSARPNRKYLVKAITYTPKNDSTGTGGNVITIETDPDIAQDSSPANTGAIDTYYSVFHAEDNNGGHLNCSSLHFKQDILPYQSQLIAGGSYTGKVEGIGFRNDSAYTEMSIDETLNNDMAGDIYIETKDYDFGNPSSLKNILYVDISFRGTGTIKAYYVINNSDSSSLKAFIMPPIINNSMNTYRLKPSEKITNIQSCRLIIQGENVAGFELNDMTIVYREKIL